jgi:hypothetical protein
MKYFIRAICVKNNKPFFVVDYTITNNINSEGDGVIWTKEISHEEYKAWERSMANFCYNGIAPQRGEGVRDES